jgi:hypothetical protein
VVVAGCTIVLAVLGALGAARRLLVDALRDL